jgi:phosphoadenosine phosphosulfate reductase
MTTDERNDQLGALLAFAGEHDITAVLVHLTNQWPEQVCFSTSFSYEDQVITDLIHRSGVRINLFTLDTGRLFGETYSTWTRTLEYFKLPIQAYYPDAEEIAGYVQQFGPNAFYESVELRKNCCQIRKVGPLKRALRGRAVWITGLRSEHSPNRKELQPIEWDPVNEVIKYHPLLHWTDEQVQAYIHQHHIPYNPLHDKGFLSIGCAPCTRAIEPGEDMRAGRWWWEDASKKECGLHIHGDHQKQ